MAAVVIYDSDGGIWIWIGGIWQRWWDMAAVVVYGSGGAGGGSFVGRRAAVWQQGLP